MRLRQLFEDGRIVQGVNTTVDVGPGEIKTQTAKFGNTVDRDGRPPTLSKKVKGKSTNVLYNLGLTESVSKDDLRKQLAMGVKVEMEHTDDPKLALKIAIDHIKEDPFYYDHLKFVELGEKWSTKYKRSINCSNPKGFSQKAHCAGRKKNEDIDLDEGVIDAITDFLKPYIEKAQGKLKKLQGAVKQEYMETDLMWEIMKKGNSARPFEIEFANKQFKDVLKGVGLGAWLALPIPGNTLWITLLEKLLNKFDVSIMPDEVKRQVFNSMYENFADGKVKGKSRPGRVKRSGASCNGSVTDLRKRAKNSSGEKAKMYHWCANMKSGKKK